MFLSVRAFVFLVFAACFAIAAPDTSYIQDLFEGYSAASGLWERGTARADRHHGESRGPQTERVRPGRGGRVTTSGRHMLRAWGGVK